MIFHGQEIKFVLKTLKKVCVILLTTKKSFMQMGVF